MKNRNKRTTIITSTIEVKEKSDNHVELIVYPNPNKRVISTDRNKVKSISSSNTEEIYEKIGVLSGFEDCASWSLSNDTNVTIITENDGEKVGSVSNVKPIRKNGKNALEVEVSTESYQGKGTTAKNALSYDNMSSGQEAKLIITSEYSLTTLDDALENKLKFFQTLSTAVKAVDFKNDYLVEGLFEGTKEYTVFTPTDLAFKKLPDGIVDDLLKRKNKLKLQGILEDHVCKGKLSVADIKKKKYLRAVSGKRLKVRVDDDGNVFVANAKIVTPNFLQAHGYSHAINRVLE
jgi:uncharacterized surface protein with fasciclin (FAS1) repeats